MLGALLQEGEAEQHLGATHGGIEAHSASLR
jgi:hypothetical protein